MAFYMSETLSLNIEDLSKVHKEFNDDYRSLFDNCQKELRNTWILKLRAMKECQKQQTEFNDKKNSQKKLLNIKPITVSSDAACKFKIKAVFLHEKIDDISYDEEEEEEEVSSEEDNQVVDLKNMLGDKMNKLIGEKKAK